MPTEVIRERNAAAGAWAAAAFVLAIGALGFGVTAHLRANELEAEVARLTATAPQRAAEGGEDLGSGAEGSSGADGAGSTATDPDGSSDDARVAVVRAFTSVYDSTRSIEDRMSRVDDPTGVAEALETLEAGPNGQYVKQVVVSVNDVRFLSDTEAEVTYTITIPTMEPATGRSGKARLIEGTWKVARVTLCGDLVAAGGGC